jgi:hypothetical protein
LPNSVAIKEKLIMWKDWTNIALGLWLAASPWLIGGATHSESVGMVWNCVLTGGAIVIFSGWAAASPKEVWQEWVAVLLGLWLTIAPGTLKYDIPVVTGNDIIVGLAVAIFAIWRILKQNPTTPTAHRAL